VATLATAAVHPAGVVEDHPSVEETAHIVELLEMPAAKLASGHVTGRVDT
jgi:hypothetical protein